MKRLLACSHRSRAVIYARTCSGSADSATASGGGAGNGGEDDSWQRVASFGGAADTYESNYSRIFAASSVDGAAAPVEGRSVHDLRAIIDQNNLTIDDVRLMVGMFGSPRK